MRARHIAIGLMLCTVAVLQASGTLQIPHAYAQQLGVSLKTSKRTVEPKQTFVYSVTVRNNGGEATEKTTVSLSLDERLDATSASNDGSANGDKVEWKDISLAAGQSQTFTASVRVDENAEDGTRLYATAVAGGDFAETVVQVEDMDDANNDDERAITVRLYSNKAQAEPGEPMSLIVEVENRGQKRAANVDVTVEMAENLTFLSASNQGKSSGKNITWEKLEIDGDEKRTLTASVRVADDALQGESLISTAYAEGAVNEHKINVWDPEFGREQMQLHMFTDTMEIQAGDKLTYTLRVRNLADHNEKTDILAYIDPRVTVVSASGDGQQFEQNLVIWEHASFSQNETQSFTLSVQVPETFPAGELHFSVQAGLDRRELVTLVLPSQSGALLASALFGAGRSAPTVNPQAQAAANADPVVVLTQTADKTEAQPGSSLTYSLTVANAGNQALHNLHVQESFPAGTVEVVDAGNGTRVGNSVQWMIPLLEAGSAWNATYHVRTYPSLTHGSIVMSVATVQDEGGILLANSQRQTNIISTLPQAGWGAFVIEVASAKEQVRIVQPKPTAQQQTTASAQHTQPASTAAPRGRSIAWGIVLCAGAFLGMMIAIMATQNAPEKLLLTNRTANA